MTNKFTITVHTYLKSVLLSTWIAAIVVMTFGFVLNWSYLLCTAIIGGAAVLGPVILNMLYYFYWLIFKRKKENATKRNGGH